MRKPAARIASVRRFVAHDEGQDLIEYGLLVALIALAAIVMMRSAGVEVNAMYGDIVAGLQDVQ
jgi:Flp pilus assembly pilin Flp